MQSHVSLARFDYTCQNFWL